jgi:NADH:ubiquinone oxidoreductase subunit 4 (subunit M)
MDWFEALPVAILIALIAVFGVFPGLIFSRISPAVEIIMRVIGGG